MKHNEIELEDWKDFASRFPLYEQLRNKTIGITGATGLLGSCMVHCLEELDRQHAMNLTIVCFVRNEEKAQQVLGHPQNDAHSGEALGKNIIILKHDFSKTEEMPQEVHIDYLVHFASPTASQYFVSKPVETMMTDFDGTAQLLRFALRQNTASIVNVSSLEVYGSIYDDSHPLSEEEQGYIHLSDTRSSYPVAKRAAECLCHAYAQENGVHVKTARLAQTFGAGVTADDNRVFAQFARNIIAGEDIVLHTTGELSRCYCYTIDAIEAILFILLKGEDGEYRFVMVAKGGGSANKTYFYPMTKATIQNEGTLLPFLVEKMKSLGTAACPPYHIAFVIGGTSAEKNLLTVKLASIKYYDALPTTGDETGRAFRDIDLEEKLLKEAHKIGLGAQFGGKYLAHDIRVIRLPRHGASCPIGMGVSCSADRNIKGKITKDGIFLEVMDSNPSELIPEELRRPGEGTKGIEINLDNGIEAVCAELSKYPVSTRVNLKGTIIVARDIAHAKLKARLDAGEEMPEYFKNHPILYAGPAKTPEGYPCGSMGPTTANRMDPYVDEFQDHGASLVMIAKGNRSQVVTDACKKHGGFYLGTIGGVAAVLSQSSIKSIECVEYPELGMEAIWKITVEDFPAFILVDDKGNDFFQQLKPWCPNCK